MTRGVVFARQPRRRAAAPTGMDVSRVLTRASNRSVKPLSFRAQGKRVTVLIPAIRAPDTRHTGMQPRLMLEEVEVAPGLCLAVVRRTVLGATFRAGEAAAGGKVDVNVQSMGCRIEVTACHGPGCAQPKGQSQQVCVAHCVLWPLTDARTEPDARTGGDQGRFAPRKRGGLRLFLTAASPCVRAMSGRDEETALNRTRNGCGRIEQVVSTHPKQRRGRF